MELEIVMDHLKRIQIGLTKTPGISFDTLLKISSLAMICGTFALGVLDKYSQWGLLVFGLGCSYQLMRIIFYFFGAMIWNSKIQSLPHISNNEQLPLISIIVPCFNEEKVIQQSINSLLAIDYANYEVIVVDDGSTDNTLEILKSMKLSSNIKIITQKNSGKAIALNNGVICARGEYILCVDADSILHKASLLAGIRHFICNPKIVAIAGSVRVSNKNHFITCYQDLEYSLGDLQKQCLSNFGKVNIIPGPVGLFKKSAILKAGGYELIDKTFAEDTELTLRLISQGGQIVFEPNMISYTEAPTDWLSLLRQRYRWTRGIYQALRKNLKPLHSSQKNYLFGSYLFLEKVWVPTAEFTLLAYFIGHFITFANMDLFFAYTAVIFIVEISLVALSARYTQKSFMFSFLILLSSRFSASIVISTWKYLALLEEWNQVDMTWDKLSREGLSSLNIEPAKSTTSEVVC